MGVVTWEYPIMLRHMQLVEAYTYIKIYHYFKNNLDFILFY